MTKAKTWIFFFLAVTLLFVGMSRWRSTNLPYDEEKQSQDVHKFFFDGYQEAEKGLDVLQACSNQKDHRFVFCVEGFFYGLALLDYNNKDLSVEQIFRKHQEQTMKLPATYVNLWAVPFGIAQPYSNRDWKEVRSHFNHYPPHLFKYFVDGWAMSSSHRFGLEQTLQECDSRFGQDFHNICLWGAGRAEFLYRPKSRPPENSATALQNGFYFARNFTRLRQFSFSEIEKMADFPRQAAESIKNFFRGDLPKDGPFREVLACLMHNHVTECETIFSQMNQSNFAQRSEKF